MFIPILHKSEFETVIARATRGFSKERIAALYLIFVMSHSLTRVCKIKNLEPVCLRQSCARFLEAYVNTIFRPPNWKFQAIVISKTELKKFKRALTTLKKDAYLRECNSMDSLPKKRTL